jgi:hypothetical protein
VVLAIFHYFVLKVIKSTMLALKCERMLVSLIIPKVFRVQIIITAAWQTKIWLTDESPFRLRVEVRIFILILAWCVPLFL